MRNINPLNSFGNFLSGAFTFLLIFTTANHSEAVVSLPNVISDYMVLQREQPVQIWGWADPGENVTVRFQQQVKETITDTTGRWEIQLDPMSANTTPSTLQVSGENTLQIQDVLVGEVWLCSGQSNMEMRAGAAYKSIQPASIADPKLAADLRSESIEGIRLFRVEKIIQPPEVVSDGWQACEGEAFAEFSAIGYLFAKRLKDELSVPVGIIQSAWGGTRIEPWTPTSAYQNSPIFQNELIDNEGKIEDAKPGWRYEAMVQPLAPFSIKGVLWYQGESNLIKCNDGSRYADKMELLIKSWREEWNLPELPFYYVQIAPFLYSERTQDEKPHPITKLPDYWQAQFEALRIPFTAMAPTMDLVWDLEDIHPLQKRAVANRLSDFALHRLYDQAVDPESILPEFPTFDTSSIFSDHIEVQFEHVGDGLLTRDGEAPTCFEIAGESGVFLPALAEITGPTTVTLSSPQVSNPTYVRFAWNETARPNLMGSNQWPAYPFRTDNFHTAIPAKPALESSSKKPEIPDQFDIYLLIGQSNMAGRGAISEIDSDLDNNIWIMDQLLRWKIAQDPLHGQTSRAIPGKGPGLSFAKEIMKRTHSNNPIALVPCAVGGSPLVRWEKGNDLYLQALHRVQQAAKRGTIKGIIWHQGESDSDDKTSANSYQQRLQQMIQDLREDLDIPNLPIVMGETGRFLEPEKFPYATVVRNATLQTAKALPYAAYVSSEGLADKGDHLHFSAESAETLGQRYAEAMLQLMEQ